ncbi:hypothetical protein BH10CYA1_BH10CYA1_47050 [soil metagenome]
MNTSRFALNDNQRQKEVTLLPAGNHEIRFQDGRQFIVHVPANASNTPMPAMFVFSGSAHPQFDPKDFAAETGMNTISDDSDHPFVVVYALPKKHLLGRYSKTPAYAWNTKGVLIDGEDQAHAGYDDIDYVKAIVELLPTIANVDASHKDWGAIGFSHGGVFLNLLVSEIPCLFPSIALVGTTMQEDYQYHLQRGNAQNVMILHLLGDRDTLPIRGLATQSLKYDLLQMLRFIFNLFHAKRLIDAFDPLAPINNADQNPALQNSFYAEQLRSEWGFDQVTTDLATPKNETRKDFRRVYTPKKRDDIRRVTIFGLVLAQHCYPAPDYGVRTNATTKYTEFDASREFVKLFLRFNRAGTELRRGPPSPALVP